jgi:hypothetical protein
MAKKAKTTAKVKARKTAPKKHRKPFLVQGVGIFSSIPFSGTLIETAFKSGLSTGGATIPIVMVKDELGYDPTNLKNGLGELNGNAAIGLIVAIGGLVTLNQAADLNEGATNYFISIMGGLNGVPGPTSGYFRGGICLQSYNRNPRRIAKVKTQIWHHKRYGAMLVVKS